MQPVRGGYPSRPRLATAEFTNLWARNPHIASWARRRLTKTAPYTKPAASQANPSIRAIELIPDSTASTTMQVGVARVMYAMGRDRQLPAALAKIHPKHGTPYVGMIATAVISVTVSLLMRYQMDELVSIVNFGALCGFLLLHISVIVQFWVKGRSGRWIVHLAIPLAGSIVVLAVLSGMSSLALMLGLTWLAGGLVYGAILVSRRRAELAI